MKFWLDCDCEAMQKEGRQIDFLLCIHKNPQQNVRWALISVSVHKYE